MQSVPLCKSDQQGQIDAIDRRIIKMTQEGLPLVAQPYHAVAEQVDITAQEVMQRMQRMQDSGVIRRIGAVPNHYALGYKANGMSVWNVDDEKISELGKRIGQLEFVSHCYRRPRRLPNWPYNLFVMVHGRSKEETTEKVEQIAKVLEPYQFGYDVLYSTAILKKTGLRLNQ